MILDVDGTLVDSNDAHARAWVNAFAAHGVTVDFDEVRWAVGMGGDKLMPAVSGIEESSPQGKKIAATRKEIFKRDYLPSIRPFHGTRDLLERLRADGFTLSVASSAKQEELTPLLEAGGIDDLLDARTSSDDAERSKPDPDIVHAAVEQVNAPRAITVMIGDTPYDVEAALRAGISIVAFESGGWGKEELEGAAEIYAGPADLLRRYETSLFALLRRTYGTP